MLSIYRLPNKLPHEKVIQVIRKDIFILIRNIAFFLLLTILPLIFFNIIVAPQTDLTSRELAYLFVWLFFFFLFIDYYLDVWIITNERIIDIEQRGFFSRIIAEHKLFRIQDVTSEVHGILATILRFGDVHVQTAGTEPRFQFRQVPYPDKVRDTVIKLVQRKRKEMEREMKLESKGI